MQKNKALIMIKYISRNLVVYCLGYLVHGLTKPAGALTLLEGLFIQQGAVMSRGFTYSIN